MRLKQKKIVGQVAIFKRGTIAIGRLDEDSEGLLLLIRMISKSKFALKKKK
jgi:16S rRNA U516 pseudouridylate synthase RsuA-like enzyme